MATKTEAQAVLQTFKACCQSRNIKQNVIFFAHRRQSGKVQRHQKAICIKRVLNPHGPRQLLHMLMVQGIQRATGLLPSYMTQFHALKLKSNECDFFVEQENFLSSPLGFDKTVKGTDHCNPAIPFSAACASLLIKQAALDYCVTKPHISTLRLLQYSNM